MNGTTDLPPTAERLQKTIPKFKDWLIANGSAVHAPTNEWEVMRFDTPEGIGVIYRNKADALSYTGGSRQALMCFKDRRPWRATARGRLTAGENRRARLMASVAERDGWSCCYCGAQLDETSATLEHFVSRTHGGPDHLANLLLACGPCNAEASHLDVRAKVDLAVRRRA